MRCLFVFAGIAIALAQAGAQEITLPETVAAKIGRLATVPIKSTAKDVVYTVVPAGDIDIFREFDPDPSVIRLRFLPYAKGPFWLVVSGASGDKVVQRTCVIVPETPEPPRPDPGPGPKPDPGPTPIVSGPLWLIVVEETADATQRRGEFLSSAALADFMKSKGHKHRLVDKDVRTPPADLASYLEHAKGKALPWLMLTPQTGAAAGRLAWEGPVPATPNDLVELLRKVGG